MLVWIVGVEGSPQLDKIKSSGFYQDMPVVKRGGAVYLDGQTAEALYFSSPNSLPWAMEQLKPRLYKALEPKKARDAAREESAARAAERAEDDGDFIFEFGTPAPTPEPTEGPDGNGDEPGATPGPTSSSPTTAKPETETEQVAPASTPNPSSTSTPVVPSVNYTWGGAE